MDKIEKVVMEDDKLVVKKEESEIKKDAVLKVAYSNTKFLTNRLPGLAEHHRKYEDYVDANKRLEQVYHSDKFHVFSINQILEKIGLTKFGKYNELTAGNIRNFCIEPMGDFLVKEMQDDILEHVNMVDSTGSNSAIKVSVECIIEELINKEDAICAILIHIDELAPQKEKVRLGIKGRIGEVTRSIKRWYRWSFLRVIRDYITNPIKAIPGIIAGIFNIYIGSFLIILQAIGRGVYGWWMEKIITEVKRRFARNELVNNKFFAKAFLRGWDDLSGKQKNYQGGQSVTVVD